jgi:hypothetical protein
MSNPKIALESSWFELVKRSQSQMRPSTGTYHRLRWATVAQLWYDDAFLIRNAPGQ